MKRQGEDAPEFLPYGLTLKHKHVPEMQQPMRKLARDPIMQPAVGNFAQGMITVVPLQLGRLPKVPTGAGTPCGARRPLCRPKGGVVEVAPLVDFERSADIRSGELQRHQPDEAVRLRQRRDARRHC